jgi:hypothetical protein
VDLVVCLYAIYHLIRNPKTRPPGSSASYHFFALVTDAGFIPFYVFTVLLARRNSDMDAGTEGRWRTMFPTDEETDKVLMTTWLTAIVAAGFHLLSACLDMYLATVFRKISRLPPDMNPLEDNLTSRRKTKHKHKNSSISAITPLTSDQEKRFSDQSTIAGDRNSQYKEYKDVPSPTKNQVAFMHTRTDSETTYSPHTPASARQSKERFSMYSQPPSAYQSRKELNHRDDLLRNDDDNQTLAQRKSMLSEQANIKRHSRNDSYLTNSSKNDFYTPPSTGRPGTAHTTNKAELASGDLSLQRNSRETLQQDNWFVHPDDEEEEHYQSAPAPKSSFLSPNKAYNSISQYDDASDISDYEASEPMMPQPLRTKEEVSPRMNPLSQNPPTPPPPSNFSLPAKSTPPPPPKSPGGSLQRTLTTTSVSTEKTFDRSHSRSGTPKSRYYGNLAAATQGVRSGTSPSNSPSASPTKNNPSFRKKKSDFPSAASQYSVNAPPVPPVHSQNYTNNAYTNNHGNNGNMLNSPFPLHKKSYTSIKRQGETGYTPKLVPSPRVISRSGVDYMNPYEFDDSDLGSLAMPGMTGRRRDVSGKVAEEGRGGLTQRKVSGMV